MRDDNKAYKNKFGLQVSLKKPINEQWEIKNILVRYMYIIVDMLILKFINIIDKYVCMY